MDQPEVPPLQTAFLMRLQVVLAPAQVVGLTPNGERRIYSAMGGRFAGPGLAGEVLPGTVDWWLRQPDGSAMLDVRVTLRTDDEALIYVTYRGLQRIPLSVRERLTRGEIV